MDEIRDSQNEFLPYVRLLMVTSWRARAARLVYSGSLCADPWRHAAMQPHNADLFIVSMFTVPPVIRGMALLGPVQPSGYQAGPCSVQGSSILSILYCCGYHLYDHTIYSKYLGRGLILAIGRECHHPTLLGHGRRSSCVSAQGRELRQPQWSIEPGSACSCGCCWSKYGGDPVAAAAAQARSRPDACSARLS